MNLDPIRGGAEPASAAALTGLAAEVEALRAQLATLAELPERMEQLGTTVANAVDELAGVGRKPDPVRPISWLAEPAGADELACRLGELADWVARVYLRYPAAARSLPDCWLWHPDLVEELAWLHLAWQTAYHPKLGTVAAAGDWHDRQRTGVATRIRASAGTCSLEVHLTPTVPEPAAPSVDALPVIAAWWATSRAGTPPEPNPALVAAAHARRSAAARGARR
jgi:hypothetical protein